MTLSTRLLLPFFTLLALAGAAHAQAIVLKDNTRVDPSEITIANGKIQRTIKLSNGQQGQASVSFSDIDHLEWDNPKELVEARQLMAAGKPQDAIASLQKAKAYFAPLKEIKGSPYMDILFSLVEAQDAAGDFDNLIKVMPEVNAIKWDDARKLSLRIIKLNIDRRTSGDMDRIENEAKSLLDETDDAGVCAKLWVSLGDIFTKKEQWSDAFDAYLHVPVFYGSQAALVPVAELQAARSLAKMERFKDAAGMFQRIAGAYPGSSTAETAKKEALVINGLDNKPEKLPGSKDKNAKDSKEAPKDSKK